MKKTLLIVIATGIAFFSNAQGVWNGTSVPTVTTYGRVGVGSASPAAKLHVAQPNDSYPWTDVCRIDNYGGYMNGNILSIYNTPMVLPAPPSTLLFAVDLYQTIIPNKLRIGAMAATTPYNNYTLSVDGDMIARRCVIQMANWADFVFNDDYEMPTLNELEKFINTNNHLPGVPSEKEVLNNGIEVGDMNKILLQKVEELTLYMIQLQKQNDALKVRLDNLETK